MKVVQFIRQHIFLVLAIFYIAFIPLYPKLPILDVKNTWVYIRIEDFLLAFTTLLLGIQLIRRKITVDTPLTLPILTFWIIGAIATIQGVLFIFPHLQGVFPQIALLHYLRHIEYIVLFFVGFNAIKDKKYITPIIIAFAVTMILVFLYGIGQRYLGFPAFLTMNEEFAKGVPLKLSALSRVPSTFAGHYDLAAYLILMIPFMGSMVFAYKKWSSKLFFLLTAVAGLILLMMTASRVSFAVYLLSISLMLLLQKKKIFIIPVIILSIILLQSFQGLSQRFASTITQVDLVVDARTGQAIGIAENYTEGEDIVIKDEESNGENLPQGSKYINIPSHQGKPVNTELYSRSKLKDGSGQMIGKSGNVIVKKAFAYDVSYTTRLQGTWPRAIEALKRNYLLGSGYSSINIASDNNYLRILGEIGILGFLAFCSIFLFFYIYAWKIVPHIENKVIRSMVLGVVSGTFGLMLNAILIDVFEASKVAFVLWLLIGITVGVLHLYQKEKVHYLTEMKRIFLSLPALFMYLFLFGLAVFSPSFTNYFVGDDFSWLRWAADCHVITGGKACLTPVQTILSYFTDSQNFFYRPGTKLYFYMMFPFFELFPSTYHFVSFLLHLIASALVFFITNKLLGRRLFAYIAAVVFLVLSVHAEAIYWISVTGHLIAYNCVLFALLLFMYWRENQKSILFVLIMLSLFVSSFFYEFAVVGPLLLIAYDLIQTKKFTLGLYKEKLYYLLLLSLIPLYYIMRTLAHSFWMQGDYSYSLSDLPFNFAGNSVGYFLISLFGTGVMPYYQTTREFAVHNLPLAVLGLLIGAGITVGIVSLIVKYTNRDDKRILLFSLALFFIPLLPFLGLGNIAPRYSYVASVGVVILLVFALQKLYAVIAKRNIPAAGGIVLLLTGLYLFMNISALKQIHTEYQRAGEITNSVITDLSLTYSEPGSLPKKPLFIFTNVPVKLEEAWVFPVGLNDAIWFAFRETPVQVRQTSSLEEAFSIRKESPSGIVFEFLPDGSVVLVNRNPDADPNK